MVKVLSAWMLVLVCMVGVRVDATDIFVATNDNNWSTAYTNIQAALDAAEDGYTIYVAGHTFLTTTQLVWQAKSIDILGGYAATNDTPLPGTRDIDAHPTTVKRSGVADNRVFYINSVTNALLEGFVLCEGPEL